MFSNFKEKSEKALHDFNKTLNDSDKAIWSLQSIACILNAFILIIGIISNIVSSCTLLQKKLRKRKFNWYLLVTSIIEFLYCLILLVDYLFSLIYTKKIFLHSFNQISRIIIDFAVHTSDSYIGILTLFLSLDRLYAIKHPLLIKEYFTNLHAKFIIIVSFFSIILLKSLSFALCEFNIDNTLHIVYCALVSPIIFNTIPSIIILIINSLLIFEIICYYKNHPKADSIDNRLNNPVSIIVEVRESIQTTTAAISSQFSVHQKKRLSTFQKSHYSVILVSAFWTILTSIPYYTFKSYFLLNELDIFKDTLYPHTVFKIQILSSIFFNLNHCINFFIYICFHDEFRASFLKFICCCKKQNKMI